MAEWSGHQISELAQLFDGPHATPTRTDQGAYFLNISSLVGGRLDLRSSDHVSEDDFLKWTKRVTPEFGDLLFSYETRLGEAAMMPEGVRACLGRRMALLRPNSELVHPRFLLYLYLSPEFKRLIEKNTIHGATVNRIALSTMPSWRVQVPPLAEQQAIAEVLGALDDKIAANTKLAATTDEYLAARFQSELDGGFEPCELGTVAVVNAESVKPVRGGQLRYIDIASVRVGVHKYPEPTSWEDAPGRARRYVRKGDTLWSTVRPNRRSHSLNLSDDRRLVASTGIAVLSPRDVGFAYLYEATRLAEFSSYLESVAEGSAYPAVRAERFQSAPVPLLSPNRRAAFEALAAPMREHLHSLGEENRALAELRDTLLPRLMSGDLRVRTITAGV